jgi:hypothetical protein
MRRSKRELRARWLARAGIAAPMAGQSAEGMPMANQALRDDPGELNPKKRRGPPPGNQNRRIHGVYSRERRAFFAEARTHIALGKRLVAAVQGSFGPKAPRFGGAAKTEK